MRHWDRLFLPLEATLRDGCQGHALRSHIIVMAKRGCQQ